MILQLSCLAVIVLLAVLRGRHALVRREARPTWLASIAGSAMLTLYGFPAAAARLDGVLGGQNLLTLLRDAGVVAAVWFFRQALTGYTRTSPPRTHRLRLAAVLSTMTVLFLLIPHRTPTVRALVLDQIAQPAAWLYGTTYMAAVLWILTGSARLLTRRRTGRPWMPLIAAGAALTAVGCSIEIAVFTAAHFHWTGRTPDHVLAGLFAWPFFTGLATMLLGVAAITLLAPTRRRVLIGRLQLLGWRRRLIPASPRMLLTPLTPDRFAAGRTHHLLVLVGDAERAGTCTLTQREAALVARAQQLLHSDRHFHPVVLRTAA